MAKQGSGGRPSQQVKKVVPDGQAIYRKPNTPATVGGQMNPAPGALLPSGSPKRLPTLGTKLK
jgi:hypothetical protein